MTTISVESKPDSPLNTLARQFSDWRCSRVNRRTSVPDRLRQQALELLNNHRKSHVIKALGINSNMLKNWQDNDALPPPSPAFVSLHPDSLPPGTTTLEKRRA